MYPRTSYIIYATHRTGSYLLCDALSNTKVAGRPTEFFSSRMALKCSLAWGVPLRVYDASSDVNTYSLSEDYFRSMYATETSNGVFGVKIIWSTFSYCLEQIRQLEGNAHLSTQELLQTAFPHHQSLWITRRDKVRQAISWWRAVKTDTWQQLDISPRSKAQRDLNFDFQDIERRRRFFVACERQMQLHFSELGIQPFTVVYEDFVTSYQETVLQVLDYLHIPISRDLVPDEPRLQKQADEQTEEWVERYYQAKKEQETTVEV
jgi:trehalose 2-sulfotransferase